jgi:S-adenosylmethionine hydrolase
VKGFLLGAIPATNIVDVSHQVSPFHIAEASFILRNCYADFPAGSIHLVSVDSYSGAAPAFILMEAAGHYFIARDNGLLSLVVDGVEDVKVAELPYQSTDLVFPMRYIMAPAAARVAGGAKPHEMGKPRESWVQLAHQKPVSNEKMLRGIVQYVDNMGNAITNIRKEHLQAHSCRVYLARTEYFEEISSHYNEVEEGEKVCFFNSSGYLEIAINQGSAAGLLGLRTGSNIMVEFL